MKTLLVSLVIRWWGVRLLWEIRKTIQIMRPWCLFSWCRAPFGGETHHRMGIRLEHKNMVASWRDAGRQPGRDTSPVGHKIETWNHGGLTHETVVVFIFGGSSEHVEHTSTPNWNQHGAYIRYSLRKHCTVHILTEFFLSAFRLDVKMDNCL